MQIIFVNFIDVVVAKQYFGQIFVGFILDNRVGIGYIS